MSRPDFAHTDCSVLGADDLRFLVDQFPMPVSEPHRFMELAGSHSSTIESMLDSAYVHERLTDPAMGILQVSPFLFFNVSLRQALPGRRERIDRHVINYLANLLSLFASSDRVHRLQQREAQQYDYLVDLLAETRDPNPERRFLACSHIGNYAFYLAGFRRQWIAHRFRYRRRPVSYRYYRDMGRAYFDHAATHPLAERYGLADVFGRLSSTFDVYSRALARVGHRHFSKGSQIGR